MDQVELVNLPGGEKMPSIQAIMLMLYLQTQRRLYPPSEKIDLDKERAGLDAFSDRFKPLAELKHVPVDVDGVVAEWIIPQKVTGKRVILYLHGGYYLSGSIHSHRNLAGNIAIAAQAQALIIGYCLAPENPFPTGINNALTAYLWLMAQGIRPEQIFLAGDSAGGGLALALLLILRERGEPLPAAAVCLSPSTDLTTSEETWKKNAKNELILNPYMVKQIRPWYLQNHDPKDPLASPLYGDLHGLPPLLIQVGSDEALLPDCRAFAERAKEARVDVTLEVWPRMQHVWQFAASSLPEGRLAIERIGEFISAISKKMDDEKKKQLENTTTRS
jgi:monoterpene epsilon-lactone hydrolase